MGRSVSLVGGNKELEITAVTVTVPCCADATEANESAVVDYAAYVGVVMELQLDAGAQYFVVTDEETGKVRGFRRSRVRLLHTQVRQKRTPKRTINFRAIRARKAR